MVIVMQIDFCARLFGGPYFSDFSETRRKHTYNYCLFGVN